MNDLSLIRFGRKSEKMWHQNTHEMHWADTHLPFLLSGNSSRNRVVAEVLEINFGNVLWCQDKHFWFYSSKINEPTIEKILLREMRHEQAYVSEDLHRQWWTGSFTVRNTGYREFLQRAMITTQKQEEQKLERMRGWWKIWSSEKIRIQGSMAK